jgi:hypothetical protein
MTGILNALFASLAGPQDVTVIQSFTATGDWVCPTGVTEVEYLVVAGGGGGGLWRWWWWCRWIQNWYRTSVTAGTTYTVTVGGGGSSGWRCSPTGTVGTLQFSI